MKTCIDCGQNKPYEDYHRKSESPDGRRPVCKPCTSIRRKNYVPGGKAGEPELTPDQKKFVYSKAILRMKASNLISDSTRDEMLARVGDK